MKYLIANWKSYITNKKDAESLFAVSSNVAADSSLDVIVCPPNIFLLDMKRTRSISLGAQNVFWEGSGAYTGEMTIDMLKGTDVEYIILGHSERRGYFGETDEMINKKVKAVLKAGFKVILCVGEKERIEENVIPEIVADQVRADLEAVPKSKMANIIIAYEPIWAIGTGKSDTPENAYQAALFLRKTVASMYGSNTGKNIKFLYGGSVNSENIKEFIEHMGIDGVLVGGASTKKDEFVKMAEKFNGL